MPGALSRVYYLKHRRRSPQATQPIHNDPLGFARSHVRKKAIHARTVQGLAREAVAIPLDALAPTLGSLAPCCQLAMLRSQVLSLGWKLARKSPSSWCPLFCLVGLKVEV